MGELEYAVIEFIEEKAVEVVPKSWIEKTDQGLYSYWPRFNAAQRVKKGELPDKEKWTKYKVRVFVSTDCYQKALLKAKQAEETSNVDSEEEHKPRPKKRPQRYLNWSDEENGDDEDEDKEMKKERKKPQVAPLSKFSRLSSQPSLPKPPEMQHCFADSEIFSISAAESRRATPSPSPSTLERRIERFLSASSFTSITPSSSVNLSPKASTSNADFTEAKREVIMKGSKKIKDSNDNFQLSVLMKLDTVIENQQEQLAILRKILGNTKGPETECTEEILARPSESVHELEGLCQRLEENPELSKKMEIWIYYLSSLGGYNIGDCIRRMMKRIGTNRLWSEYSLKGRKGKKAFQELQIFRVLIRACLKNNSKAKANEVEEAISETLKYAPSQRGGTKYKEPEQKRTLKDFAVEDTDSDF